MQPTEQGMHVYSAGSRTYLHATCLLLEASQLYSRVLQRSGLSQEGLPSVMHVAAYPGLHGWARTHAEAVQTCG